MLTNRFRADGSRYARFLSFYIITEHDGHWGVQLGSSLPLPQGMA